MLPTNFYVDTKDDPKVKKLIQLILFTYGYSWFKLPRINNSCSRYIYVSDKKLEHNRTIVEAKPYSHYPEITVEEIYKL